MSQTVVGLFDTPADVERVKQQLITKGISPGAIRVLSNETDGFAAGAVAESGASTGSNETGVVASIKNFFRSLTGEEETGHDYYTRGVSSGGSLLAVTTSDDQVESIIMLLEASGARQVEEEGASSGQHAYAAPSAGTTTAATTAGGAIQVVQEELQVGKRQVQRGGVRVYSHVVSTPVEEQINLREEHVKVERTPVNRAATSADFDTFKEGTIELTETAEEAVVGKQARVVEEVRLGKEVSERTETIKDSVRHTEVDIEEVPADLSRKVKSAGEL